MGIIFKAILFGFTLLSACSVCPVTSCDGASPKYGNMTKDYDLLVGSKLTVQCTLFTHHIVLKGTEYNVTSENLRLKFEKTVLDDLEILDPFTVEYSVQNATINDTGIYNCFLSMPELNYSPFVCTTYITVGYPPLPIENFSCISLHYKNLTCSWTKPFNPVKTDYVIWDYLQILTSRVKRRCPVMLNETSCQWRLDSYPPYRKSSRTLYFLLIGNNTLGTNRQSINIDHFKFVKPAEVQKLHFLSITKNSLVVNWSAPSGMEYNDFPPGLVYSIRYHPMSSFHKNYTEVESTGGLTYHMMENLVPYTEYEFSVRCRSAVADSEEMWSPTVQLTARTLPDVPYLSPEVTYSSYEVKTILGNRSITLYWKSIPAEFQNGKDFQYVIQYHIHYVRSKREEHKVEVGNVTSYTFKHMDVNSAYLFSISSKNDEGFSPKSSIIVVDKTSKLLNAPKDLDVLSHGKGNYTVSWTPSHTKKSGSYTLFWCREIKPWPFKCEGPLQWMHTSDTYHQLKLYDKDTNYQFAVAANDGEQTSGMKWATCFVPYSGVLYKVKTVNLTPKNSTSIEVQWTLDCDAQRAVIKEYAINYCQIEGLCTGDRKNISCAVIPKKINVTQPLQEEYIIGSLKPYTCYRVLVRARTEDGWSEDSDVTYESTLPSAPSDPPRNLKVLKVNDTIIHISFQPPLLPNGKITRYVISYGKTPSYLNAPKHHMEEMATGHADFYNVEITRGILHYVNYSIQVVACVDRSCSPLSKPVYALTGIGNPGIMDSPHVEMVNSTFVNITWNPPSMPNGRIDMYQVAVRWKEGTKDDELSELDDIYNVTGTTFLSLNLNCPTEPRDETMYFISVRALNVKDGNPLFGQPSKETQTTLCFAVLDGPSYGLVVGVTVGCAVGLIVLILVIYSLASWMKHEMDSIKGINVQLPKGLDSPMDNPLSSYDKFKNGLQKNNDSGIPFDRAYERLCSFAAEEVKDLDFGFGIRPEGLAQKEKRETSGRNHSGESNASGKGHDSISSSNTTKTHLSIDSGAEVDSPPSPDSFFCDTSSSNTTPRSYKPDLAIVKEGNDSSSKDSGLEKEGTCSMLSGRNIDLPSKFAWYVKKKNHPYSNIQFQKCIGHMPPYSKFAVIAPANVPTYIPFGEQNLGLFDNHALSNSEPSVADFEVGSDCEPLVLPGISPYSKFGLARSAGNGLNIANQMISANQNLGYSKFGIVYRALKCQDGVNKGSAMTVLPPELKICPKFLPNHTQAMPVMLHGNSVLKNIRPTSIGNQFQPRESTEKKTKEDIGNAYSKFGIQPLNPNPKRNESRNGYVSFHEALNNPVAENSRIGVPRSSNMAYSKFGVNMRPEDEVRLGSDSENSLTADPATCSLPKIKAYSNFGFLPENGKSGCSSYVTFQDAKAMPAGDRPEITSIDSCHRFNTNANEHIANGVGSIDDNINIDPEHLGNQGNNLNTFKTEVDAVSNKFQDSSTEPLPVTENIVTDAAVMCGENEDAVGLDSPLSEVCQNSVDSEIPLESKNSNDDEIVIDGIDFENKLETELFHPLSAEFLTDNSETHTDYIKHDEERLAKIVPNASSNGYVPLSELTKESAISAHVITRPNIALPLHVENV